MGRCNNCIRLKKECVFYPVDSAGGPESRAQTKGSKDSSVISNSPTEMHPPGSKLDHDHEMGRFPHLASNAPPEYGTVDPNTGLGISTASKTIRGKSVKSLLLTNFQHQSHPSSPLLALATPPSTLVTCQGLSLQHPYTGTLLRKWATIRTTRRQPNTLRTFIHPLHSHSKETNMPSSSLRYVLCHTGISSLSCKALRLLETRLNTQDQVLHITILHLSTQGHHLVLFQKLPCPPPSLANLP